MNRRRWLCTAVSALFACACSSEVSARPQSPPAPQVLAPVVVPPDAEDAFNAGVKAAQSRDYRAAVAHFERARGQASGIPAIYYNLGLAEAQLPTRELRAIAWLAAYLAERPRSPAAAGIRTEIASLRARHQRVIDGLVAGIKVVADQVALEYDGRSDTRAELARKVLTDWLSNAYADAGHLAEALQLDAAMTARSWPRLDVGSYTKIAGLQAKAGDVASAMRTVGRIPAAEGLARVNALIEIASAQLDARDVSGAQRTLGPVARLADRVPTYRSIAVERFSIALERLAIAQVNAGDIRGALETLDRIDARSHNPIEVVIAIATAQTLAGDTKGADRTIKKLRIASDRQSAAAAVRAAQVPAALSAASRVSEAWVASLSSSYEGLGQQAFVDLPGRVLLANRQPDVMHRFTDLCTLLTQMTSVARDVDARLERQFGAARQSR